MTRIGIVGGVGPLAVSYFYDRLLRRSKANADEDYPPVVLVAEQVPSRIDHLLGRGPSPLPALVRAVEHLAHTGVDVIVIPSATTHAYQSDIAATTSVPLLNLLAETATCLTELRVRSPVFLATAATTTLGLYEPYLPAGITGLYPLDESQDVVSQFINLVKQGEPVDSLRAGFTAWLSEDFLPGTAADCVVLGCTELSVIAPAEPLQVPVVDVTDVLVDATLRHLV